MKKISIITIHCQTNFGSVFQSYALNKYLNNEGYYSEIIDYRPNYIIHNCGKGIKRLIKRILFILKKDGRKKYDSFIKENMTLSKEKYKSFKDLLANCPKADVYIAGSDQLWNIKYECGKDESFKLSFVTNAKKISYATSFVASAMNENSYIELANKISDFSHISLREESSKKAFSKYSKQEVKWVCDPVFLLDKSEYIKLCKPNKYGKYILVYLADKGDLLDSTVEKYKKLFNCKVIFACGNIPKCKCDIHIKAPGPVEMLSLVKNSYFIITGSFHATAFSHIFEKNFVVILPDNGERIESLLTLTKHMDRIIKDTNFEIAENIDYQYSNNTIDVFSKESKKWLLNAIEN